MNRLSEDSAIIFLETVDVGGTVADTGWVDMAGFKRALFKVVLGSFNGADDLDHCRIEASDGVAGGDNVEEVTSDESGGNYDTDTPIDADGDTILIEIRAEDLPDGKTWIRGKVGEDTGTGTDNVTGVLIRYDADDKYEERDAVAVAGSVVYVSPQS